MDEHDAAVMRIMLAIVIVLTLVNVFVTARVCSILIEFLARNYY